MAIRQWTGTNLIMGGWSQDITGDSRLVSGPEIPDLVRPHPTLLRVLVQYWFVTKPLTVAAGVTDMPPPVGVGVFWHPEPDGGVESDAWQPANGEAVWSGVTQWQPTVWDPMVEDAPIWSSQGTGVQDSSTAGRHSDNDEISGLGIVIDWRWDDFDIGPWAIDTNFTGWVYVRALWERAG